MKQEEWVRMKQNAFAVGLTALLILVGLGWFSSNNVPVSIASAQAQTSGTVLPLTGGTMTGGATPVLSREERVTVALVRRYAPSVATINVAVGGQQVNPFGNVPPQQIPPQLREFFRRFEQPRRQGSGSGFVVDPEGHIVTNYHVVQAALEPRSTRLTAGASLTVSFPGSARELPARVVGITPAFDLALLEVENPQALPKDAQPIPLADSDQVVVGQEVVAIGNPFGLRSTVTKGIVSAVNRERASFTRQGSIPFIQTDAPINPGNSGGPLLNLRGEVIGINNAILSPSGGFAGIGFAIPSNILKQNLTELGQGGYNAQPRLGVRVLSLQAYPQNVRNSLGLPDQGVAIVAVEQGSSAQEAGLRGAQYGVQVGGQFLPAGGDVIVAIDGQPISDAQQLQDIIMRNNAGDTVALTIIRNGKKRTVEVRLRAPGS